VWLYFRFSLSFRDVEELMAARGVILSYETGSSLDAQVRPAVCQ
jgi:transposase-like protein